MVDAEIRCIQHVEILMKLHVFQLVYLSAKAAFHLACLENIAVLLRTASLRVRSVWLSFHAYPPFRFVFPCRQWIPLTSNKGDGVRLECKSSERSRLAVIRGMCLVIALDSNFSHSLLIV
jgi:hypothetical protein